LLDIWIPPDAAVGRFRLELQLKVGYFIIRPLEIRVLPARVPDLAAGPANRLPGLEESADAAAAEVLTARASGRPEAAEAHPSTLRGIIRRNAIQDMALDHAGAKSLQERWDAAKKILGAERYLQIRDFVYAQSR